MLFGNSTAKVTKVRLHRVSNHVRPHHSPADIGAADRREGSDASRLTAQGGRLRMLRKVKNKAMKKMKNMMEMTRMKRMNTVSRCATLARQLEKIKISPIHWVGSKWTL